MVHNLGNQSWDINTAVLPPSSRRLSSIRRHHLPLHHRLNISVQITRPMLGFFVSSGQSAGPRIVYFYFYFYFSPDTAAEQRASSRPLLSAQPATRSSPPAGGRNSRLSTSALLRRLPTSLGHAPGFTAAKLHSLPASAPQPSPRLSQLQRKYTAGPLAPSFRC